MALTRIGRAGASGPSSHTAAHTSHANWTVDSVWRVSSEGNTTAAVLFSSCGHIVTPIDGIMCTWAYVGMTHGNGFRSWMRAIVSVIFVVLSVPHVEQFTWGNVFVITRTPSNPLFLLEPILLCIFPSRSNNSRSFFKFVHARFMSYTPHGAHMRNIISILSGAFTLEKASQLVLNPKLGP